MKIVVLDAATLGDADLASMEGAVLYDVSGPEETASRIAEAEIVVTNKVILGKRELEAAPRLKLVCVAATGVNNVDLEAARERGVAVANVAGYSTESVVAHTFALYFALAHRTGYYDDYGKSRWPESPVFTHLGPTFHELAGKRWGIVGLGTIGRRVAQAVSGFGCRVSYCSTSGVEREEPYPRRSLEALLAESHVVSVHAPLNDATRGLIGKGELARMKPGAILLNLGRGGIVDETALAEALEEERLFAGLDVLAQEPPAPDNPLLALNRKERLLLTPHVAWAAKEARDRLVREIGLNIRAFLSGEERNRIV